MTDNQSLLFKIVIYMSVIYAFVILSFLRSSNNFCRASSSTTQESLVNETIFRCCKEIPRLKYPPVVVAANEKHTGTIIFLHNYLQTGSKWAAEVAQWSEPYMKIVCPTANLMPLQWYWGHVETAWFDFAGLDFPWVNESSTGVEEATYNIHKLIAEEIKKGIPPERIILGGLSQGAVVALHAVATFERKLGGLVLFSPWRPLNRTFHECFNRVNKDIPILHRYLHNDVLVAPGTSRVLNKRLRRYISQYVDFKGYSGIEIIVNQEFQDMRDFCKEHVGPLNSTHNIPQTS